MRKNFQYVTTQTHLLTTGQQKVDPRSLPPLYLYISLSLSLYTSAAFPHVFLPTVPTSPVNPEQNRLVLPSFRERWN